MMKMFIVLMYTLVVGCVAKWFTPGPPLSEECSKNEERVRCAYDCEPQCGFEPTVCSFECKPNACVCKTGYVRNTKNECVHRLECTPETSMCPEDEEFHTCGAPCQPSCEDPYPTECPYDQCIRSVCRCLPGFVRNGPVCTPLSDCRKIPTRPLELFTL
ncbi:hypothetical protein L3Y34_008740 [Caenorhabditis briggsae]|uniref:TIL domain-containing protein n=2 Tax=Caenorhabditis briggsae TaxID=6238 RepID=A0AAE9A3X4_CAEBR|nr:hypothetical protein L3Y34_008740 [Caenorhabditis briggsae]